MRLPQPSSVGVADDDDEDDRDEALQQQVHSAFASAGALEVVHAARRTIPALDAYQHLAEVSKLWRGAIYLRPQDTA